MIKNASKYGKMPDVMATSEVVEPTMQPPFRNLFESAKTLVFALDTTYLAGVNESPKKIHSDRLHDRGVKIIGPRRPSCQIQLKHWCKSRCAERHVEGNSEPVHISSIEERMPWQDNTANTESSSSHDISPSADRLAIECGVLGSHYRGGNQKRNACVVHACETFHQSLLGDTTHGVPHTATDQAFACCEEEDGCEENIGFRGLGEIYRCRVEIERNCQHNY